MHEATPDHSSLSRIRSRLSDAVYTEVFRLLTEALAQRKLIKGKALGMDTFVMDANASLTALYSKLTGESYYAYVQRLAQGGGVNPTDRAAVVAFDRKRKDKKLDNAGWEKPNDPEAKVGRTKKGTIRMIYKSEHVVDMEQKVRVVIPPQLKEYKGANFKKADRSIIEKAVAATKSDTGKQLLKQRANLVERSFHHVMDCGDGRRATLRGYTNILKTYVVRAACCNLSLLMRNLFGFGAKRQTLAAS